MIRVLVAAVVALFSLHLCAAGLSPEESKKHDEFRRAYQNTDKAERQKALAILEGEFSPTTRSAIIHIATNDGDREVRVEAYQMLSKFPARDQSLALMLVQLFNALKPNDIDTRFDYARAMGNSDFKAPIVEVLADFGSKLQYPDPIKWSSTNNNNNNNNNSGGPGLMNSVDPNVGIKKKRQQFETFVSIFNSVAKADIRTADKSAPLEFKKWIEANRLKVNQGDRELVEKYRAEDLARRDKDNPLVPRKDERPDKEEDKKAKN